MRRYIYCSSNSGVAVLREGRDREATGYGVLRQTGTYSVTLTLSCLSAASSTDMSSRCRSRFRFLLGVTRNRKLNGRPTLGEPPLCGFAIGKASGRGVGLGVEGWEGKGLGFGVWGGGALPLPMLKRHGQQEGGGEGGGGGPLRLCSGAVFELGHPLWCLGEREKREKR